MERRNLALLCAGVVCFWLFALAFGTAQGKGLRIQPAVQTQAEPAVQTLTVTPPQLTLPCRAAILIDQNSFFGRARVGEKRRFYYKGIGKGKGTYPRRGDRFARAFIIRRNCGIYCRIAENGRS